MAELPAAVRDRHAEYLLARQQPDGGFPGRDGGSDLYYTGFALRGLSLLGRLYGPVAERAAGFLHDRFATPKTIVDFLSLIYGAALLDISAGIDLFADQPGDWRQAAVERLQALRRSDGGYAKSPEGHASSTYHSFLVLLCLQLLGSRPSEPERLAGFILSQRTPEGGFREIRARSGPAPTRPRRRSAVCGRWVPGTRRPAGRRPASWPPCRRRRAVCGPTRGSRWPTC